MINKVILIGNVGGEPEIRTLESGVKVARVSLATTERIYNPATQQSREHTEWHRITLWRGLADVVDRYVRTGSQLYIEGRIRSNEWTDNEGVKRYGIEILADDMKLLGKRSDNVAAGAGTPADGTTYARPAQQNQQQETQQQQESAPKTSVEDIDDLPF